MKLIAPKPTGLPVPPLAPRPQKIAPVPVAGDDDEDEDLKPPKVYFFFEVTYRLNVEEAGGRDERTNATRIRRSSNSDPSTNFFYHNARGPQNREDHRLLLKPWFMRTSWGGAYEASSPPCTPRAIDV